MRLLLDTHVIIWWVMESHRLRPRVVSKLLDADTVIYASPVSAWEISRKRHIGKLDFSDEFIAEFGTRVQQLGWYQLPLTIEHTIAAAQLPGEHKDPFDRMLAGQALVEELTVVTVDPAFGPFNIKTLW
jgi:PIN domain nuclease of toxin-antitoxin system